MAVMPLNGAGRDRRPLHPEPRTWRSGSTSSALGAWWATHASSRWSSTRNPPMWSTPTRSRA